MKEKDKKFCFAGTLQQYENFLKENRFSPDDVPHIDHVEKILGIKNAVIFYYGTYYKRDDYLKIKDVVKLNNFKERIG